MSNMKIVNARTLVEYTVNFEEKKVKKSEEKKFNTLTSKSQMFIYFYDEEFEISEISKLFIENNQKAHYSFVYSVISNSREVRTVVKETASDIMRRLYDNGLTVGAIAKQLNKNYSFVHSTIKKYKIKKELELANNEDQLEKDIKKEEVVDEKKSDKEMETN